MIKFPDIPDLSSRFSLAAIGQFISVLVRKVRQSLVSASGASQIMSGTIAYGQTVTSTGTNDLVAIGAPDVTCIGVRVNRPPIVEGQHIAIKSCGEADCMINPNDTPGAGDCIWIDPAVNGVFTVTPQIYPTVGVVLSNADFAADELCRCMINLPVCTEGGEP